MSTGRSRRQRVLSCAVVVSALVALLVAPQMAGAAHRDIAIATTLRTRDVCGSVTGHRVRCAAVQVMNPDAQVLQANVRVTRRRPVTTTTKKVTTTTKATTTTKPTTTSSSTTTTKPTTTSSSTTTSTTQAPPTGCTTAHAGYTPCDIRAAYALGTAGGAGTTVAIVDAYDDPNAESDLAIYRAAYGLAPCTTANGCFRKVNQTGGTSSPAADTGWAEEISLDVDMVSAACPNCHILLVEASSNSLINLLAAENTAAALGAKAISNSWGAGEFSTEANYDSYMNHGIPITASTGDGGYGVSWPAASPYVTAVGGTSLVHDTSTRGWSETAWAGAGSGCSAYEPKPAFQTDTGCPRRAVADVSAIADPNTGVATYDSYNVSGWLVFGGTSVAAPIVASIYAVAGNGAGISTPSYSYSHTSSLFDVTSGSNGSCGGSYLCTAVPGFDGPTGNGSPNGTGAF